MTTREMALLTIGVALTVGVIGITAGPVALGWEGELVEASASGTPTAEPYVSTEPVTETLTIASHPSQSIADLTRPASADEMFSEFTCPCCGELIGDCSCGMASERRAFVSGLVAAELTNWETYLAYAVQYGMDGFVSEEAEQLVRDHNLANAPAERPQIVLEPQKVDLGDVGAKETEAEAKITIKNVGNRDLIVDSLSTSCGCTTASVVNDGLEGPVFGSGTPPDDWSTTIGPGETAELRIDYDPSVHQDARGPMMREIYVSSNDPVDPVIKAAIQLNQVD